MNFTSNARIKTTSKVGFSFALHRKKYVTKVYPAIHPVPVRVIIPVSLTIAQDDENRVMFAKDIKRKFGYIRTNNLWLYHVKCETIVVKK